MNNSTLHSLIFFGLGLGSVSALATKPVQFHVSAEGEYDSSVGISELDDFTREADSAWIVKGGAKGRWQGVENFSLGAHYEFTNHNYSEQNAYDQTLHHFSLSPQLKLSAVNLGFRHDNVIAELAGDEFMDYRQNAFSAEGSLSPAFYLRIAYNMADKSLTDYAERNADVNFWSGDLFWFSTTGEHFIALSIKSTEEDARDDLYDFDGNQWKLAYTRKFHIGEYVSKLKFAHSEEKRDYTQEELVEGPVRKDDKSVNEISFESGLSKHVAFVASLELVNNNSNVASVAYDEEVTSIGLRCSF